MVPAEPSFALSVLLPLLYPAVYTERLLTYLDSALRHERFTPDTAEAVLAFASERAATMRRGSTVPVVYALFSFYHSVRG